MSTTTNLKGRLDIANNDHLMVRYDDGDLSCYSVTVR